MKKRLKSKVLKTKAFISLEEVSRYAAIEEGVKLLIEAADEAKLADSVFYLTQVQAEVEARLKSRGCRVGVAEALEPGILLQ